MDHRILTETENADLTVRMTEEMDKTDVRYMCDDVGPTRTGRTAQEAYDIMVRGKYS